MRIHIEKRQFGMEYNFFLATGHPGQPVQAVAQPITFLQIEEKDRFGIQPATLTLHGDEGENFIQDLVNQAWDMGIRPRYAKDGSPENTALKYHLEDMRTLVFKT